MTHSKYREHILSIENTFEISIENTFEISIENTFGI